jgi:hypothetical protein
MLTPWVFYWHMVPLLGIVAVVPWSLTSLVTVVLSVTLVPLAAAGGPALGPIQVNAASDLRDTLAAFASRYGGALVALLWGWWAGRRAAVEDVGADRPDHIDAISLSTRSS